MRNFYYLFLTRIRIQDEVPWCMLFADDIVLIDVTRQRVNDRLESWRHTLEDRGFWLSRSKTKYLHCCFSGRIKGDGEITMDGRVIPKVAKFKYLGSIIQQNGDIDEDISCLLYTSPSPRDGLLSRMPSSA